MNSESLLKTRRLNKIIQRSGSDPVRFSDLARVLGEFHIAIYLLPVVEKILGYALEDESWLKNPGNDAKGLSSFTEQCNSQFLKISETLATSAL